MGNRSDNFTRANNATALGTPSDGGSAWVALAGTWGIVSDLGYNVDGGSEEYAYLESGLPDAVIVNNVPTLSVNCGICFRVSDINNLWVVTGSTPGHGQPGLFKKVAGSFTQVLSLENWIASPEQYKIVLNGSSISVYEKGVLLGTATDAFNQTATKHGLYANADTGSRISSFTVSGQQFDVSCPASGSVGNQTTVTVTPNLPAAAQTTVTVTDDLGANLGSLVFAAGATAAQTLTYTPAQAGIRTLSAAASPAPAGSATTTASMTVYGLSISPTQASSQGQELLKFTATLAGGAGALAASVNIGLLTTASPVSGTPFGYSAPNANGTATITVTGPGGSKATATVIYSVASDRVSMTTTQAFPLQYAGLRGTVGFTVYNGDGTTYEARNTANVAELGNGNYLGQFPGLVGASYTVIWDTGGTSPAYGTPDYPTGGALTTGQIVSALAGQPVQPAQGAVGAGRLVLVIKDSYTGNRALNFYGANYSAVWPADLTGYAITLTIKPAPGNYIGSGLPSVTATGSVVVASGSGQQVQVTLTSAETSLLSDTAGPNGYEFDVVAISSTTGDRATLITGVVDAVQNMTP